MGGLPFWVFSVAMIWRRDDPIDLPGLFGFGPKPGYFVVQKRNETPETKHLKHFLWMFGLLFCKHFKELGGKVKDGVHRGQYQ